MCSAPEHRFHNREWATFDMLPTMLASIGVEFDGDKVKKQKNPHRVNFWLILYGLYI